MKCTIYWPGNRVTSHRVTAKDIRRIFSLLLNLFTILLRPRNRMHQVLNVPKGLAPLFSWLYASNKHDIIKIISSSQKFSLTTIFIKHKVTLLTLISFYSIRKWPRLQHAHRLFFRSLAFISAGLDKIKQN